jgi:transposase
LPWIASSTALAPWRAACSTDWISAEAAAFSTLAAIVRVVAPCWSTAAGAKLFYLPKYSPDLNPIEQVFAKLKHLLRKAAARTVETVCAAIGEILGAFSAEECANYFRNSGYQT